MRTIFSLLFGLLFIFSCTSEAPSNYIVKYDFTFAQDALQPNKLVKDEMILEVSPEGMTYLTNDLFKSDTTNVDLVAQLQNDPAFLKSLMQNNSSHQYLSMFLPKDSSQYYMQAKVNALIYHFKDEVPNIEWVLIDEEKKILDYKVKKASTTLFNREWIAWYAEDFKSSYGPYKFNGLPGLILELSDIRNHFHFKAKELLFDTISYANTIDRMKVNSTKQEFIDKIKEYKAYPFRYTGIKNEKEMVDVKKIEERKEELKRYNNAIEKGLHFDINR